MPTITPTPIVYGAKTQFSPDPDESPPLSATDIELIQGIGGAFLYYARTVDSKLLQALSIIGTKQASTTCCTNYKVNQLLDYFATYPNNDITYRASNMNLSAHSVAPTSMPANPKALLAPTSGALEMTLSLPTMDPSSPSHKSSNLLRHLLPNPNLLPSSFAPKKWSLSIKMGWPHPQSPI
eukprot:CCRYP_008770-RA/>CCRYP_008770-RA protein AED:0.42 eAED:0.42 QI:0/0/0/1/0/0/2/0/180